MVDLFVGVRDTKLGGWVGVWGIGDFLRGRCRPGVGEGGGGGRVSDWEVGFYCRALLGCNM